MEPIASLVTIHDAQDAFAHGRDIKGLDEPEI